ncbi:MAG: tetratricopeptide repeat protein [Pirellulaceae bacterium]
MRAARISAAVGVLGLALAAWRSFAPPDRRPMPAQTGDAPPVFRVVAAPVSPLSRDAVAPEAQSAQYVGTDRCVACHPDEHASFQATAHSRSLRGVDPAREPPDAVFDHVASGRRYRVYRRQGQLRHGESLLARDGSEIPLGDYPLTWLVGSGRFTRSYLVEDAGFLIESPITWYASLQRWDMSPGYDRPAHRSFHRVIERDCLYCHAGVAAADRGNVQRLSLHEQRIGCERCHGPGSAHVDRWTRQPEHAGTNEDPTIVNPARLPRELRDAICQQCHLTAAVRVPAPGRQTVEFRPGRQWQEFAIDYDFSSPGTDMTVTGHVAQLHQSPCFQNSGTLTCLSCHPAHAAVSPQDRAAHYRAACLTCHDSQPCRLDVAERTVRNGDACAACHMPASPTEIPHLAFTHHRIGIHASPKESPSDNRHGFRPLVPLLDISHLSAEERQRSLGLACLQYYRDHADGPEAADYLKAAHELLAPWSGRATVDSSVAMGLAELAGAQGDLDLAVRWATALLNSDSALPQEQASAHRLLAGVGLQQQRWQEAAIHLDSLTDLCRDPRDWVLLGVCRLRQGQWPEAIAAWERVLAIDPSQPETYGLLASAYGVVGNTERQAWCRRQQALIQEARER